MRRLLPGCDHQLYPGVRERVTASSVENQSRTVWALGSWWHPSFGMLLHTRRGWETYSHKSDLAAVLQEYINEISTVEAARVAEYLISRHQALGLLPSTM